MQTHLILTEAELKRFLKYIVKLDNGCWLWAGRRQKGYGYFTLRGKPIRAHRLAWMMWRGPIPEDKPNVLHNCPAGDNTACINPSHLWVGTHSENRKDCCNKGRQAFGLKNGKHTHPESVQRGEENGFAKLTNDQVCQIRALYKPGVFGCLRIAKRFNTHSVNVWRIVKGISWKHTL